MKKERQMERQKKEMEDKLSQIKISETKDRKKLIEERKTVNLFKVILIFERHFYLIRGILQWWSMRKYI